MKYDGEIKISWNADSGDVSTAAKGCDGDVIDVLAKVTIAILQNASLDGLRNKALLNAYIAYLNHLHTTGQPIGSTCIKIPVKDIPGGVK